MVKLNGKEMNKRLQELLKRTMYSTPEGSISQTNRPSSLTGGNGHETH